MSRSFAVHIRTVEGRVVLGTQRLKPDVHSAFLPCSVGRRCEPCAPGHASPGRRSSLPAWVSPQEGQGSRQGGRGVGPGPQAQAAAADAAGEGAPAAAGGQGRSRQGPARGGTLGGLYSCRQLASSTGGQGRGSVRRSCDMLDVLQGDWQLSHSTASWDQGPPATQLTCSKQDFAHSSPPSGNTLPLGTPAHSCIVALSINSQLKLQAMLTSGRQPAHALAAAR